MIWGVDVPQIEVSSVITELKPSIIVPTYADARFIENISVVNGERTYNYSGDYSEFAVIINMFKVGTHAQIKAFFGTLYGYRTTEIDKFYPHKDGTYLRDDSNNAVPFAITEFTPFYLDETDYRDKLRIVFKSKKFVNLANSII